MTVQISFKRNDWVFLLDHDFGQLCRGGRTHISRHSDGGMFSKVSACSILTWVYADTASACPAHPDRLAMTSITFAAAIYDADEPCTVHTA